MVVSNRNLLFQGSIFRGYVSFREGIVCYCLVLFVSLVSFSWVCVCFLWCFFLTDSTNGKSPSRPTIWSYFGDFFANEEADPSNYCDLGIRLKMLRQGESQSMAV